MPLVAGAERRARIGFRRRGEPGAWVSRRLENVACRTPAAVAAPRPSRATREGRRGPRFDARKADRGNSLWPPRLTTARRVSGRMPRSEQPLIKRTASAAKPSVLISRIFYKPLRRGGRPRDVVESRQRSAAHSAQGGDFSTRSPTRPPDPRAGRCGLEIGDFVKCSRNSQSHESLSHVYCTTCKKISLSASNGSRNRKRLFRVRDDKQWSESWI